MNRFSIAFIALSVVFSSHLKAETDVWKGGYLDFGPPNNTRLLASTFREIFTGLGINVEINSYPSFRSVIMANQGALDFEMARVEEVIKQYPNLVKLNVPITNVKLYLIHPDTDKELVGMESLSGKRILINKGMLHAKNQIAELDDVEVVEIIDQKQIVRNLERGRVKYAITVNLLGEMVNVPRGFKKTEVLSYPIFASIHVSRIGFKEKLEAEMKKYFPVEISSIRGKAK